MRDLDRKEFKLRKSMYEKELFESETNKIPSDFDVSVFALANNVSKEGMKNTEKHEVKIPTLPSRARPVKQDKKSQLLSRCALDENESEESTATDEDYNVDLRITKGHRSIPVLNDSETRKSYHENKQSEGSEETGKAPPKNYPSEFNIFCQLERAYILQRELQALKQDPEALQFNAHGEGLGNLTIPSRYGGLMIPSRFYSMFHDDELDRAMHFHTRLPNKVQCLYDMSECIKCRWRVL